MGLKLTLRHTQHRSGLSHGGCCYSPMMLHYVSLDSSISPQKKSKVSEPPKVIFKSPIPCPNALKYGVFFQKMTLTLNHKKSRINDFLGLANYANQKNCKNRFYSGRSFMYSPQERSDRTGKLRQIVSFSPEGIFIFLQFQLFFFSVYEFSQV